MNMKERKLSGGGSTRRVFLIAFHVVEHCGSLPMCMFFVTNPRLPFARSWSDKTEIKKFKEKYGHKGT